MTDTEKSVLRRAITDEFIATGKPVRVAAVATRVGWSEAKVRKLVNEYIPGITIVKVEVPTYSKSFPDMQRGTVRAWAYQPTLEAMRQMVIELRK